MKKLFSIIMLFMFSIIAYAQDSVTQFLGIPVDGSKSEMIRKLKEKGYQSGPDNSDILDGEFNGREVNIHVASNNNKVYRIMVHDANGVDERSIQIRFNNLCEQFKNNPRYISNVNFTISDEEDISYEMIVNKKRYQALFYQDLAIDTMAVKSAMLSKYTSEQLAELTEEAKSDMLKLYIQLDKLKRLPESFKRPVWFTIGEHRGKYYIAMYYDNECNRANGEDL